MKKIFSGFSLSFNLLSIIPFFRVHDFYRGINGYAVLFYPLVGFILGLILYGIHSFLTPYFDSSHLAIITLFLWILITGGLHLDGFSDTIDGLFVNKERSLEVMKDSHIGGMGMIFSVAFLLIKASSLIHLNAYYLLPIILMFSRFNASLAIYFYEYVSKSGIASLAKEEFNIKLLTFTIVLVLVTLFFYTESISLLFICLVTLFLVGLFFKKRYGGFSGDIYGFLIEVSEVILLNAIILGILS